MTIHHSVAGFIRIAIISADLNGSLSALTQAGIRFYDIVPRDELAAELTISRKEFAKLRSLCQKRGDQLELLRREGIFWWGIQLLKRPVLVAGLLFYLLLALWVPQKVFFVRVEGNQRLPARLILEEAEKCGIGFGAERRKVRSEKVKNALLEAVPLLQWAGVNTEGCVAVITVRERVPVAFNEEKVGVGHVVALHNGVITDCTATKGALLCAPGQAVTEGQILISGYTDCGITIRAEQAEGEVYALTRREISAFMALERQLRLKKEESLKKISLLFGKKRIKLWKDSGIWDSTCDRMYEEYYITLPGGFQLPLAIAVERCCRWEVEESSIPETEGRQLLTDFGVSYLQQQMVAGTIHSAERFFRTDDGRITMAGQYICVEMIGKMQRLQIGENNG